MKKKKGFTLIELLAVIIILAVVALIATPMVLNVVEEAKKSAAESEANMIYKAINDHCKQAVLLKQSDDFNNTDYIDCTDETQFTVEKIKEKIVQTDAEITLPTVDSTTGEISELKVTQDNYTFTLKEDKMEQVNLITFTVDIAVDACDYLTAIYGSSVLGCKVTYEAEEGMTWGEWINSDYNKHDFGLDEEEALWAYIDKPANYSNGLNIEYRNFIEKASVEDNSNARKIFAEKYFEAVYNK